MKLRLGLYKKEELLQLFNDYHDKEFDYSNSINSIEFRICQDRMTSDDIISIIDRELTDYNIGDMLISTDLYEEFKKVQFYIVHFYY